MASTPEARRVLRRRLPSVLASVSPSRQADASDPEWQLVQQVTGAGHHVSPVVGVMMKCGCSLTKMPAAWPRLPPHQLTRLEGQGKQGVTLLSLPQDSQLGEATLDHAGIQMEAGTAVTSPNPHLAHRGRGPTLPGVQWEEGCHRNGVEEARAGRETMQKCPAPTSKHSQHPWARLLLSATTFKAHSPQSPAMSKFSVVGTFVDPEEANTA